MNNRFELQPLSVDKANAFWSNIKAKGLAAPYGEYLVQLGHPLELKASLSRNINNGAIASHRIIVDGIKNAGGVTEWMKSNPVTFGPYTLNNPVINTQIDMRLEQGYGLPIEYDTFLTRGRNGEPEVKVIELHTAISYETVLADRLCAAGYDPNDTATRFGSESPADRYASFPQLFANGEPIVVMDTDPFDATRIDKIGMQKMVGRGNDLPISPLDLIGKDNRGYYYHPYVVNPENPHDVSRDYAGNPIKDTSRIDYAKHVLTRMAQYDLNQLWNAAKHNPAQAEFIAQFLNDSSVNWIWHPTWQHLGDKAMLPVIRAQLLKEGNDLADQFVPVFGSGELITEPGKYIRKPTGEQGGVGQSLVTIDGQDVVVEPGYIYQQLIVPYPVISNLPGRLAAGMRRTTQTTLRALDTEASENSRPVTGQLEIRSLIPPYWQDEIIGRHMSRLAPRWLTPDELLRTQTNVKSINMSVFSHLSTIESQQEHILLPYGNGSVVVYEK